MVRSKAAHELLKYNGGNAIFYCQMSNHKGALVRIPSATSASGYAAMLNRKENFMKELTEFMGGSMNKSNGSSDAAKCILQFFFENFEEEFKEVAKKNNVLLTTGVEKIGPSQVEAMLHEAGIGKSNSRVLFRHLNQFFGKPLFASEKVRRQCFSRQEFQPVVDIHELSDKTKVNYWYKLPHEMLQHHVRYLFCSNDFCNVSGIHITVGGDHGKGKSQICIRCNYQLNYILHCN